MRILLVQTSFPGDTVLSTPLISAIQQRHPGSELWMLTTKESAELVIRDPLLKGVLTYDKRRKDRGIAGMLRLAAHLDSFNFDIAYSLHRSARTALLLFLARIRQRIGFKSATFSWLYTKRTPRKRGGHEIERNLSLLGEPIEATDCELRLFALERDAVFSKFGINAQAKNAVIVPGSVWPTKRWLATGFKQVAENLLAQGFHVLMMGSNSEVEIGAEAAGNLPLKNLVGQTNLSEAMTIISAADLMVCNDSLSLHIASAFKIPVVSIFGATTPAFGFGPWRTKARIVERALSCRPCSRHGSKECPIGTFNCMREISSAEVCAAVGELGVLGVAG